jgi:hypothetical protein
MNHLSEHLSFAQLADAAERREAAAGGLEAALTHAAGCASCGAQLARLEHLVALMRSDAAEDAPRDVVSSAVGLFRRRDAEERSSVVGRILAALSFDSWQSAPAYGLRSGEAAPAARHLMFTAGERDLSLHIAPSGEAWAVAGQVLGEGLACVGGEAVLQGEMGTTRASLNELCEFTLPAVASGSYTLFLRLNDIEVEVPTIDLRA